MRLVSIKDACNLILATMNISVGLYFNHAPTAEVKQAYCTVDKSRQLLVYRGGHSLNQGIEETVDLRNGPLATI